MDIDKEKAFKLMKEAASLGSPTAQFNTGIMYIVKVLDATKT